MNEEIEACTDEERSTSTDYSASFDIDPEQQIPSTVQFTMHAKPLSSPMEINTKLTSDHRTDSDYPTSFLDVSSASAQVVMPAGNDHHDHCNILHLSFVYAFGRNPDPRIVVMSILRLLRE